MGYAGCWNQIGRYLDARSSPHAACSSGASWIWNSNHAFGYFFSITGLLVWWAVSILVVLASNKQQTLFDWVFP